jgi:ribosome-associated toxin RatA of RatAB toxin-antitoxin module
MRHVEVTASVPDQTARDLFPLLCDMEQYPKSSEAILSLTVAPSGNGSSISTWKVKFGPGVATWSEEDWVDPVATTIRFKRLSGDIENFAGAWSLRDDEKGCTVQFAADFDIGLPALSSIIEPMVETALRHNVTAILTGILGDRTIIAAK